MRRLTLFLVVTAVACCAVGCSPADAARWFFLPHQSGFHCPAETGFRCVGPSFEWPALNLAALLAGAGLLAPAS